MNVFKLSSSKIKSKPSDIENLQAPEIEELDDSQVLAVVGGALPF
ncbi:MAG: hypothetical protein RM338_25725 [Nostoc sp. DedQUE12a]|nr:hypothetical protein [Nostoc sp. DedQUE12a]